MYQKKRYFFKIYTTPQVYQKVQAKAEEFGLPASQYSKFILLKDIDPQEKEFSREKILKNEYPE